MEEEYATAMIEILLTLVGLVMLISPATFWKITERWKNSGDEEPSMGYVWATRFGGTLFLLAGLGSALAKIFWT